MGTAPHRSNAFARLIPAAARHPARTGDERQANVDKTGIPDSLLAILWAAALFAVVGLLLYFVP